MLLGLCPVLSNSLFPSTLPSGFKVNCPVGMENVFGIFYCHCPIEFLCVLQTRILGGKNRTANLFTSYLRSKIPFANYP